MVAKEADQHSMSRLKYNMLSKKPTGCSVWTVEAPNMCILGDRGSISKFRKWAPFHFQRKITLDMFLVSIAHHNLRLFADELVNHETTKGKTEKNDNYKLTAMEGGGGSCAVDGGGGEAGRLFTS